jgi:hypothetical protein
MKKILIALSMFSAIAAQAGVIATAPNNGGGSFNLKDEQSLLCETLSKETARLWGSASSTSRDGVTLNGCWTSDDDGSGEFEIRWTNGKTVTFRQSAFAPTNYYFKKK